MSLLRFAPLLRLALTNLRRHRVRALLGAAGIGCGVAVMLTTLGIVDGAIGQFQRILAVDSDYLVFERHASDLFFSSVRTDEYDRIRSQPEVAAAYPLLFTIVATADRPVITCFGLSADDPRVRHSRWLAGTPDAFAGAADNVVFLGSRAAEFLHARLGDSVPIGRATFRVGGILKLENGFEDGGVFLPLASAQRYFHRDGVCSVVAVKLKRPADGPGFVAAMKAADPALVAMANRDFNRGYTSFRVLTMLAWAVGGCACLLGGLGVANTMQLSVFARIREIAVLRVSGFSRGQVARLVVAEAVAIATLGCAGGGVLGAAFLLVLPRIPFFQGYVQAALPVMVVPVIVIVAFVTAIAGSLYPALFATRIEPTEALRYE
ncbi:MAG TPA: ABC transporter permease [Opitutaceae bacterium]|nr:ABC transporter permease [Opitutaceae bacterium]